MNCPKCGSPIGKGDLACPVCNMPIALMQGTQRVQEVITPPLKNEPSSMEPYMHTPIVNPPVTEREEIYKNYGEGKKAFTSFKFLIPIVIGIFMTIGVGFGVYYVAKLYITDQKENKEEESLTPYQVTFATFTYTLDGTYTYSKDTASNLFHLSTSDNNWNASLQVVEKSYASIVKQKNAIKSYFTKKGYTINNVNEQIYQGTPFLTMEATKSGKNYLLALTKAGDSSYTFGIVIETRENTFGYDLFDSLSTITSHAKYEKKETNKKEPLQFDFKEAVA